jgi:hypothetical protein
MLAAVTPVSPTLAPHCGSEGKGVCGNRNYNRAMPACHGLWWRGHGVVMV